MTFPDMSTPKPMGVVGAGQLASMIWKDGDQFAGWRYRFNLFRMDRRGKRISQLFRPSDVIHLVKLAQVLAAVLADDGCLTAVERGSLKRLADDLDQFWNQTASTVDNDTCECGAPPPQDR